MNFVKHQLILLDQDDLLTKLNTDKYPKNVVIQNPFRGAVNFVESEVEKLQILINATYNFDAYDTDEVVKYSLNRASETMNLKLTSDATENEFYRLTSLNNDPKLVTQDFLPLYLLAAIIAILVLLIFSLSIAFAVWWNRHKRPDLAKNVQYKSDADSTKHPLLISEPNTPHLHDQLHGNVMPKKDGVHSPDLTSGSCQLINPMRYNLGGACSSSVDGLINQGNMTFSERMPFVLTGGFDDYPIENVDLMTSVNSRKSFDTCFNQGAVIVPTNTSSVSYSTLPLNFKLVYSTKSMDSTFCGSGIDSHYRTFSPNQLISGDCTGIAISSPTQSLGSGRHLAKDFLDENLIERMGLNILTRISEKDIANFNPGDFSNQNKQCPLDNMGMYQHLSSNTGQGSDETSGILSDSSGSTLDRPAQCSNAKITAGFSIVPSVITSNERYVSLDANDQRYIPLSNVIAEVANCPQHSYLVKSGQFPGVNISQQMPACSRVGCIPPNIPMDWNMPSSSSVPISVVHGVQLHGIPAESKLTSGTVSNASSIQTVIAAEDVTHKKESPPKNLTFSPKPVAPSRSNKSTPKPPRRDCSSLDRKHSDQKVLIEAQKPDKKVYYEMEEEVADDEDGGASSSPRSALKGSRAGGRISKQLRFTTLGLLCFMTGLFCCNIDMASADMKMFNQNQMNNFRNYVIDSIPVNLSDTMMFPLSIDSAQFSSRNYRFINVKMTIFLPRSLLKGKQSSGSSNGITSFQLYLNESSSTQVDLGEFKRDEIDIYDVRNSLNILTPEICRQRYSCSHSCDPGNGHKCTCQRGYTLSVDMKTCIDINECSTSENICGRYGGICVNIPGSYQCRCDGKVCKDCSEKCPSGYFKKHSCRTSKYLQCEKCTTECSPGYYISKQCTEVSNIQCRACRPLCITGEFELSPCSGSSNRVCQSKSSISGIELPDKKNVWFEDRRYLKDIVHILPSEEASKISGGSALVFERESGYQIHLKFRDSINLEPILEPVDHSSSNDNSLFRPAPNNLTLKTFCPYPVPPVYLMNMLMHYNVTTEVMHDPLLPGYRPTLQACTTYIQHGEYPDPDKEINKVFQSNHWSSSYTPNYPSTLSCLDSGKLPSIFGDKFNEELAIREGLYVEEKHYCSRIKTDCQRCMVDCAHHMISNSLVCKPTGSPADNGRSPRLETCFDCCTKENCTATCEKYATQRCAMHLCMTGPRMDIQLLPEWPYLDTFICHMKSSRSKPIFSLTWSLYKDKKQLTMDEFHGELYFNDGSSKTQSISQVQTVFKNLIYVTYTSNIDSLPDIISGTAEVQNGYMWNYERLPITSDSATVKPAEKSASVKVWSHTPLGVNTGVWRQLSKHGCHASDHIIDQLNIYAREIPPYRQIPDVRVERVSPYNYKVTRQNFPPKLNFTIPAESSLLGAIFSPVWVYRKEYLSASLIYLGPESGEGESSRKGYWIVEITGQVSNFPGYFRLQLWNGDTKDSSRPDQSSETQEKSALLDYDIGVFEEKNFKVHLRVPAPSAQPTFDKTYLVKIIDSKGELDIYVHRSKQDPKLMMQIEKYRRAQDGKYNDEEPSILPEVMAMSREKSLKDISPFGIPSLIMFSVIGVLAVCLVLLLIGHLTRKEEHLCEDIMFRTRHIVVFVVYMTIKAIYCFTVTTTTLLIVIVIYTREPYFQLTSQNTEYINNSVGERLLMAKMDAHLERELSRQLEHVIQIKDRCDKRLMRYYERLNQKLEEISTEAARRRSRVLISQAVVERAQYELKNMVSQLTRNLEDFNKTAKIYMKKIEHDMKLTKKKVAESEWLEAARLIYKEFLRQRNEGTISKDDPTKSFLSWLKITGELPETPPQLTLPSNLPFPDWSEMNIPIPKPRVGSGLDAEYGPEYKPFNPKEKDLELEQSIWSYYDPPEDSKSGGSQKTSQNARDNSESKDNMDNTVEEGSLIYTESIETIYRILVQLTWYHLIGITILLDLLWLLHRAAHTIDTAEQILYGYPCFIDCTVKGKRRRKRNENNLKFMLKRTFCETMESSFVPKFCGSAFILFIMYLLSTHLNELISEEALDFVGYYDNMALPAHLRNRFVNTQVVHSAQQLNEFELSAYEQFIHQRQSEIQDILNSWVDWTSQLEYYQCEILKQYKTDESGKLISDILNKPDQVPIPTHCKMTLEERKREKERWTDFKMSVCPVSLVVPQLFVEYNETEVSLQIVKSSRHWLKWTRKWVDTVLQCLFAYVSSIILWNTVAATIWFYVKRFSLIRQKRIYETDFQSIPVATGESDMKSSTVQ